MQTLDVIRNSQLQLVSVCAYKQRKSLLFVSASALTPRLLVLNTKNPFHISSSSSPANPLLFAMAENGRTPLCFFPHFCFLDSLICICLFIYLFILKIHSLDSWKLLLKQLRELERLFNFDFFIFINPNFFLYCLFSLLLLFWWVQIIRKGFYQTKHVEHKGQVLLFIYLILYAGLLPRLFSCLSLKQIGKNVDALSHIHVLFTWQRSAWHCN